MHKFFWLALKPKEFIKMQLYELITPTSASQVPILLSIPHAGIHIPTDLKANYVPAMIEKLDDTDFFLDQLYHFATEMGITILKANYSRWVIDLNRDANNAPLYQDGRVITDLVPTTDFLGNAIYLPEKQPSAAEIQRRTQEYYLPYHTKIAEILQSFKKTHGHALLYDAHSIRQYVPAIRKDKFPDFILGSNQEQSAHPLLIEKMWQNLSASGYSATHNTPFQGGAITRNFGKPAENIHALQLERAKINYMNDSETEYAPARASIMQQLLKKNLLDLIDILKKL